MLDNSGLRTNVILSFSNIQYGGMTQQGSLQQSLASGSVLQPGCMVQAQQGNLQQSLASGYKWDVWLMPNMEAIN